MEFGTPRNSMDEHQRSLTNFTIVSTPRPQASSTVERRALGSHIFDVFPTYSPPTTSATSNTSSLGLINDISTRSVIDEIPASTISSPHSNRHETQRKLARELLQKLNEQTPPRFLDTDKENNVNSPNLSDEMPTLINSPSFVGSPSLNPKDDTLRSASPPKTSINSVVFEPNEITGRSSSNVRSPESIGTNGTTSETASAYKPDGFSFNSTAAELMAKFSNEEFLSGSRMNSQISSDEVSWGQNFNPLPPSEKERLDFSCFSGIIGDMDLSLESCAGRRVSVGEFFGRKCEPFGQLQASKCFDRPAFGFEIQSPKRSSKPGALVNLTIHSISSTPSTEAPQLCQEAPTEQFYTTCTTSYIDDTRDDDEPLISLSGIAKALDSNDETPRRLVDQLLMVKRKEKEQKGRQPSENGNCTGGTYTVQSRSSLPLFPQESQQSCKLSLDSKSSNPPTANTSNVSNQNLSSWSPPRTSGQSSFEFDKKSEENLECPSTLPITPTTSKASKAPTPNASSPFYDKESLKKLILQQVPADFPESEPSRKDVKLRIRSDRSIKTEVSSPVGKMSPKFANSTLKNPAEKLRIGETQEGLYKCIIGVPREADIEMINESDRWLVCSLHLLQIQGDKDNIHLEIPDYTVLVKPSQSKVFKIIVKLSKATGPVLAALTINCSDMTTRESFTKHHMMCFVPSDAKIDVSYPEGHLNKLTFAETRELSIGLENKDDVDVPLEASIVGNEDMFTLNVQSKAGEATSDKSVQYLILRAKEKSVITLQQSDSMNSDGHSKLVIRLNNEGKNGSIIREIPLIGYCKINKASLVDLENKADKMEQDKELETLKDTSAYSRCDTPQHPQISSLPSSPHSVSSSTSTHKSGRGSPRSLSSGGTVAGDTIPIQSTHSSLSWTTVRVGKYEIKEFTIRNTSSNKIKLQAVITDNDKSFKFLKDRDSSTIILVSLQRMESKTFSIVYSPSRTGASAGKITFFHYDNKVKRSPGDVDIREREKPSRIITLYGCGGYAKVNINQALKIMGAQMWLSLGQLNSAGTLTSTIQLENSGDLPAYVKIKLSPKALYPSVETSWHVEPTEVILGPKQSQWITIEFKPRKEDIALLRGDVADMGTLMITHGDEPTRWRIRRLYKKLKETGQLNDKQNDVFKNAVDSICRVFPGETPIPQLSIIRDAVQELGVLCRNVHRQVVTLMMDLNSDETISVFSDDDDESQMFQSLCSDMSVISVSNEDSYMPSESFLDRTLAERPRGVSEEFKVSPGLVTLNPPISNEATVMISSGSSNAQPFEIKITNEELLSVVPAGGMIPAKRSVFIKIQCKKNIEKNFQAILHIFTSNERRDVKIKVVCRRH